MKTTIEAVEINNLPSIVHDPAVRLLFLIIKIILMLLPPTVVYNLEKPIHTRIFIFDTFVSNLDVNRFLQDKIILPCKCERSEFIDQDHQHMLTGNLKAMRQRSYSQAAIHQGV